MNDLRSTFPLDDAAITRSVLREILTDPISWLPLLPPVALYTFFSVPGAVPLILGVCIFIALLVFWKSQWPTLVARQEQIAIREHNARQDALLAEAAAEFQREGHGEHARWMNRFLRLKQKIESHIHESALNVQKIQVERLVDALCFEARDQLGTLLSTRSEDFSSIAAAYDTLEAAASQIDSLLGPGDSLPGPTSNLEEIASRLREETEIARRVHARLQNTSAEPSYEPPGNLEKS